MRIPQSKQYGGWHGLQKVALCIVVRVSIENVTGLVKI